MLDESAVTAAALMSPHVFTVQPDDTLRKAVRLLAQHHVSGLPVVDKDGHLVGMFTEGDLVRWHEGLNQRQVAWLERLGEGYEVSPTYIETLRDANHRVKAVMSIGIVTVSDTTPGGEVAQLMLERGIKRMPVIRDGKLVGIISRSDLVRALSEALEQTPAAPAAERHGIDEALRHGREEALHQVPKLS